MSVKTGITYNSRLSPVSHYVHPRKVIKIIVLLAISNLILNELQKLSYGNKLIAQTYDGMMSE